MTRGDASPSPLWDSRMELRAPSGTVGSPSSSSPLLAESACTNPPVLEPSTRLRPSSVFRTPSPFPFSWSPHSSSLHGRSCLSLHPTKPLPTRIASSHIWTFAYGPRSMSGAAYTVWGTTDLSAQFPLWYVFLFLSGYVSLFPVCCHSFIVIAVDVFYRGGVFLPRTASGRSRAIPEVLVLCA